MGKYTVASYFQILTSKNGQSPHFPCQLVLLTPTEVCAFICQVYWKYSMQGIRLQKEEPSLDLIHIGRVQFACKHQNLWSTCWFVCSGYDLEEIAANIAPNSFDGLVRQRNICCLLGKVRKLWNAVLYAVVWNDGKKQSCTMTGRGGPLNKSEGVNLVWDNSMRLLGFGPKQYNQVEEYSFASFMFNSGELLPSRRYQYYVTLFIVNLLIIIKALTKYSSWRTHLFLELWPPGAISSLFFVS